MAIEKFVPFGLANITLTDDEGNAIKFDGKMGEEHSYLQVEGGSIEFEPELEEIVFADYGASPQDHRTTGYNVTATIVAGQETVELLQLALAGTETIKSDGVVTGVADGRLGASNRARGRRMNIHPRFLPADQKENDYTLYKVASTGSYTREFGNEQGQLEIELTAYPRDNADASSYGNFFYSGAVDPHADETAPDAGAGTP